MQKPQSSVSSLRHRRAETMHGVIFDFASSAVHVAVVGTLPQTTDVQDLPRAEFVPYYPIKQLSHELKTGLGRLVNWPQDQDQLQQAQINIWNMITQVCLANYSIISMQRGVTAWTCKGKNDCGSFQCACALYEKHPRALWCSASHYEWKKVCTIVVKQINSTFLE